MIRVRELKKQDLGSFIRLMEQFYAYSGEKGSNPESIEALFRRVLDPSVNLTYIAAFNEARMIGICSVTLAESSYKTAPFAWVDDMYVEEQFRSQGVGFRLLEEVRKAAEGKGCSSILLGVGAKEDRAQNFYVRSGFKEMPCKLFTLPLY